MSLGVRAADLVRGSLRKPASFEVGRQGSGVIDLLSADIVRQRSGVMAQLFADVGRQASGVVARLSADDGRQGSDAMLITLSPCPAVIAEIHYFQNRFRYV